MRILSSIFWLLLKIRNKEMQIIAKNIPKSGVWNLFFFSSCIFSQLFGQLTTHLFLRHDEVIRDVIFSNNLCCSWQRFLMALLHILGLQFFWVANLSTTFYSLFLIRRWQWEKRKKNKKKNAKNKIKQNKTRKKPRKTRKKKKNLEIIRQKVKKKP